MLGGFAALFLYSTWENNPTAALFPRLVASTALLLLLLTVASQWRAKPKPRAKSTGDDDMPEAATAAPNWPAVLALQAAYILAIYVIGFSTATLIYLVGAPLQMAYRRWPTIAATAVLLTIAIAGSFTWFFHIRLPKGILWSLF